MGTLHFAHLQAAAVPGPLRDDRDLKLTEILTSNLV